VSRSQKVDLVFIIFFYYFHFLFDLILYFIFIELKVRVDGHRSWDIGKRGRRGNVIQHVYYILASCLTHGYLG